MQPVLTEGQSAGHSDTQPQPYVAQHIVQLSVPYDDLVTWEEGGGQQGVTQYMSE